MQIDVTIVQSRFRPHLVAHRDGGAHLDALLAAPGLSSLVSDADASEYAGGAWSSRELEDHDACPEPSEGHPTDDLTYWLDDRLAAGEQWSAYRYLADGGDRRGPVLQLGGRGVGLVRWMRATGRSGVLLAPFDAELDHCRRLARTAGVVDGLLTIRAPAEANPLAAGTIGTAFAPGVLHHTDLSASVAELRRVLTPEGRFASWDVWASPAYRLGIGVFGKQEAIRCEPLDRQRIARAPQIVPPSVSWGGCLTRYPVALSARLGLPLRPAQTARWGLLDRALCRCLPPLRWVSASMVSIHGTASAVVELPETASSPPTGDSTNPPALVEPAPSTESSLPVQR